MSKTEWFEVSNEGFKALQEGKPKAYVVRELLQNALDEGDHIQLNIEHQPRITIVEVIDDGPGFRNLTDAYTLFDDTYKRYDATKRGRFNLGEKQAFIVCNKAKIETTSGTILFDKTGRHRKRKKRQTGTSVTVEIPMNKDQHQELLEYLQSFIIPQDTTMTINGKPARTHEQKTTITATLLTEIAGNDKVLRKSRRKTTITLYKPTPEEQPHLYEMGIPITKIDHPHHIDIGQRVPMNVDRDLVSPAFLRDVFTHILNETHTELEEEQASDNWVRMASTSKEIKRDAMETVLTKRFGPKYASYTPTDPNSVDEAISNGVNVIKGGQMNQAEWKNAREHGLMQSTHDLYGATLVGATPIPPTDEMKKFARIAKKVADHVWGLDITVSFVESEATLTAQYGDQHMTVNITKITNQLTDNQQILDLIYHELGHEKGNHTETAYHQALTEIGSKMTTLSIEQPDWLENA